jgi:hypothetical protein
MRRKYGRKTKKKENELSVMLNTKPIPARYPADFLIYPTHQY